MQGSFRVPAARSDPAKLSIIAATFRPASAVRHGICAGVLRCPSLGPALLALTAHLDELDLFVTVPVGIVASRPVLSPRSKTIRQSTLDLPGWDLGVPLRRITA